MEPQSLFKIFKHFLRYFTIIIIYIPISGLKTRYRNYGYRSNQLNVIYV